MFLFWVAEEVMVAAGADGSKIGLRGGERTGPSPDRAGAPKTDFDRRHRRGRACEWDAATSV